MHSTESVVRMSLKFVVDSVKICYYLYEKPRDRENYANEAVGIGDPSDAAILNAAVAVPNGAAPADVSRSTPPGRP
jgi:hypothetical protein